MAIYLAEHKVLYISLSISAFGDIINVLHVKKSTPNQCVSHRFSLVSYGSCPIHPIIRAFGHSNGDFHEGGIIPVVERRGARNVVNEV